MGRYHKAAASTQLLTRVGHCAHLGPVASQSISLWRQDHLYSYQGLTILSFLLLSQCVQVISAPYYSALRTGQGAYMLEDALVCMPLGWLDDKVG